MVHPSEYSPNEAWIFLKLNHVPVSTELEGVFDVFALIDAANLNILGIEFVPGGSLGDATSQIGSLLEIARSQSMAWPEQLLISEPASVATLVSEAESSGVSVDTATFTRPVSKYCLVGACLFDKRIHSPIFP